MGRRKGNICAPAGHAGSTSFSTNPYTSCAGSKRRAGSPLHAAGGQAAAEEAIDKVLLQVSRLHHASGHVRILASPPPPAPAPGSGRAWKTAAAELVELWPEKAESWLRARDLLMLRLRTSSWSSLDSSYALVDSIELPAVCACAGGGEDKPWQLFAFVLFLFCFVLPLTNHANEREACYASFPHPRAVGCCAPPHYPH